MTIPSDSTNTAASTGTGIISSLGVGSGLNVNSIISQLMAVQNQPVTLLQNQESADISKLSAFGTVKGALSTFQTALQGLNNTSSFQSVNASIGNPALASVTAGPTATAGAYSLTVNQLAQSQSLTAAGQASATSSIGTGTISFNFGTTTGTVTNGTFGAGTTFTSNGAAPKTVTITSSDDSLTGIAAAINSANIGVTASILNDGSSNPSRLTLTTTATGAASSMQISVSGSTGLSNLLSQDPTSSTGQNLTQTSAAQDAQFSLNGLAVSSPTNTDNSVIPGVSLKLLSANASTPTTLVVSQSNSGAISSINSFVSAYNTLEGVLSQATAYNAQSKQSGPLQGQNSVNSISRQIQAILDSPVPGSSGNAVTSLAQVGVTFNQDGTLAVNSTTLQTALNNNPSAVSGLFASIGSTNDPLISFKSSSAASQPGAYPISISQLATQSNTVGSAAAGTTITAGVNDTLQVNLNGSNATVVLAAGTYTNATLASALQTAINSNSTFAAAGFSASVAQNAGVLTLSSNQYGSTSVASISGGDGLANLFGATPTATAGLDVAGTINGEAATGQGQILTGGSADTSGLAVQINGGNLGARGTLNYTNGYITELNNLMTSVLSKNGQIQSATDGLNASITDINKTIASDNAHNQQVLAGLQAEYSALDVTLQKLNSTSTYLTSQLAALSSSSSSS